MLMSYGIKLYITCTILLTIAYISYTHILRFIDFSNKICS